MAWRIQLRRDTAAKWALVNPVLALAEPGYEMDTRRRKTGDGVSKWNDLPYDAAFTPEDFSSEVLRANSPLNVALSDAIEDPNSPVGAAINRRLQVIDGGTLT